MDGCWTTRLPSYTPIRCSDRSTSLGPYVHGEWFYLAVSTTYGPSHFQFKLFSLGSSFDFTTTPFFFAPIPIHFRLDISFVNFLLLYPTYTTECGH